MERVLKNFVFVDTSPNKQKFLEILEKYDIINLELFFQTSDVKEVKLVFDRLSKRKSTQHLKLCFNFDLIHNLPVKIENIIENFDASILEFLTDNVHLKSFYFGFKGYTDYEFKNLYLLEKIKSLENLELKYFYLSEENCKTLGRMIEGYGLKELKAELYIFDKNIQIFSKEFIKAKNLRKLLISRDTLKSNLFYKSLMENTSLTKLSLLECTFNIDLLANSLLKNKNIKSLKLLRCSFDVSETFTKLISELNLEKLNLKSNSNIISDNILISLFQNLKKKKLMKSLKIDVVSRNVEFFEEFRNFLIECKNLKKLQIDLLNKSSLLLNYLSQALDDHPSIKYLTLQKSDNEKLKMNIFERFNLSKNQSLKELCFNYLDLTQNDIKKLLESIKDHSNIKKLYLSYNNLHLLGKDIGNYLLHNKNLEVIEMSSTKLDSEDFKEILNALKENKTLKSLNIRRNKIRLELISELISTNNSITDLNFDIEKFLCYTITDTLKIIELSLRDNYSLTELNRELRFHEYIERNRLFIKSPFKLSMNYKDFYFRFQ